MPDAANAFRIATRWTVEGRIEEVAAILQDAEALPAWWGAVYLGTQVVAEGAPDGVGKAVRVRSKGWLPYELDWTATLVENAAPHRWSIAASGDLEGQGLWTLSQQGGTALAEYDWQVTAERPVLRALSPLLAPVFAWNHRWAMRRGEEGLRREILRRRRALPDPARAGASGAGGGGLPGG